MPELRVLVVEDDEMDARLAVRSIERGGYTVTWERVDTRDDLRKALHDREWDVVLSDHALPGFDALEALRTLQELDLDLPFIVVSGTMTEEIAASTMRAGAHDFMVKGRLTRLVPALERELRDAATRRARAHAESARREAEVRMATVVTSAVDAIITTDADGRIESVNPATVAMFGWPAADLVGLHLSKLMPEALHRIEPRGGGPARVPVQRSLSAGRAVEGVRADGSTFPVDLALSELLLDGQQSLVGIARDLTERASLERRLEQLQHHDLVTGLPNRDSFVSMLDAVDPRCDDTLTVVAMEIDRLRLVADGFGQAAADRVLLFLADRLRAGVRTGDVLARVDSNVFAVGCMGVAADAADAAVVRFRRALREPVLLRGTRFYPTGRIALSSGPLGAGRPAALLAEAVATLDLTEPGDELPSARPTQDAGDGSVRLQMESDLQEAVRDHRFRLAFQPEIDLTTGRMTAVEALVRWTHPTRGNVPPGAFIPLAERMGLIAPIGRWVLRAALEELARWRSQPGGAALTVAVNVSSVQLARDDLVEDVVSCLEQTGLPGDALCVEVTESAVLKDLERAIGVLSRLEALGTKVAIDDFGTGYSSLGQLKHLPVHVLKIDQSFVDGLPGRSDDYAIVEAVLGMTRALHLSSVAEGVETADQLATLQRLGCDTVQGFLLSRPMPGAEIDELVDRNWLG